MRRDSQTLCWVRTGILSLLLAATPPLAPCAQNRPDSAEAPAAAPLPEVNWLQTLATLLGPSLTTAIRQGRDHAYPHGQRVPKAVRSVLAPFFSPAVLQKVRYSTAWQDATAQATLYSVLLGSGANAVTLIDVIIFRDEQHAADPVLWAHELTHVEQYDRLGAEGFAVQYLQQAWVLEHEASARAETIKGQLSR
jgi:Domain of unknown function (DUF4157)